MEIKMEGKNPPPELSFDVQKFPEMVHPPAHITHTYTHNHMYRDMYARVHTQRSLDIQRDMYTHTQTGTYTQQTHKIKKENKILS